MRLVWNLAVRAVNSARPVGRWLASAHLATVEPHAQQDQVRVERPEGGSDTRNHLRRRRAGEEERSEPAKGGCVSGEVKVSSAAPPPRRRRPCAIFNFVHSHLPPERRLPELILEDLVVALHRQVTGEASRGGKGLRVGALRQWVRLALRKSRCVYSALVSCLAAILLLLDFRSVPFSPPTLAESRS